VSVRGPGGATGQPLPRWLRARAEKLRWDARRAHSLGLQGRG
jgi:hypothetical protein